MTTQPADLIAQSIEATRALAYGPTKPTAADIERVVILNARAWAAAMPDAKLISEAEARLKIAVTMLRVRLGEAR